MRRRRNCEEWKPSERILEFKKKSYGKKKENDFRF